MVFVASHIAFNRMRGWQYRLWDEKAVEKLCRKKCSQLWGTFRQLKHDIQRVDLAKYMIAETYGGVIADLAVPPRFRFSKIVGDRPDLLYGCSRPNSIANDLLCVGPEGRPGIFE